MACKQAQQTTENAQTQEHIIIADSGDSSGTSGGTEVVGHEDRLNTYPPEFHAFNSSFEFSDEYQINIKYDSKNSINLSEIILFAFNEDMNPTKFNITSSSHAYLFDNDTQNYIAFSSNDGLLQINLNLSREVLLQKISFYLKDSTPALYQIEVKHLHQNQLKKNFLAFQLHDSRADFISDGDITTFNTSYKICDQGKKRNFDGNCYYPRVLCSDFNSRYEQGEESCGFKRDGVEVYCFPVSNKAQCESFSNSICQNTSNYLTSFSQLYTLHHEGIQVASMICSDVQVLNSTK